MTQDRSASGPRRVPARGIGAGPRDHEPPEVEDRPVSSAIEMNTPGGSRPRVGWLPAHEALEGGDRRRRRARRSAGSAGRTRRARARREVGLRLEPVEQPAPASRRRTARPGRGPRPWRGTAPCRRRASRPRPTRRPCAPRPRCWRRLSAPIGAAELARAAARPAPAASSGPAAPRPRPRTRRRRGGRRCHRGGSPRQLLGDRDQQRVAGRVAVACR